MRITREHSTITILAGDLRIEMPNAKLTAEPHIVPGDEWYDGNDYGLRFSNADRVEGYTLTIKNNRPDKDGNYLTMSKPDNTTGITTEDFEAFNQLIALEQAAEREYRDAVFAVEELLDKLDEARVNKDKASTKLQHASNVVGGRFNDLRYKAAREKDAK